jgi:putative flippase GtrA
VGLTNTAISFFVYYVIILINTEWYLVGSVAGWIVSVFNAWFWSRKYVFPAGLTSGLSQLLKSYISYGCTGILGTFLLFIAVEYLFISEWLAPFITLCLTVPLNYFINKNWTFK